MARFVADENFPGPVVASLRSLGHDVLTIREAGITGCSDRTVLITATAGQRVVVTLNQWDYVKLHNLFPVHSGIIVCSENKEFVAMAQQIHAAVSRLPSLNNKLIRVNRAAK